MLAAPLCGFAAVRGKKGDRWTLGYVGAWALFLGVVMLIGVAERGDRVTPASDEVGLWALGLLAVVYLVVLPLLVLRYRRRKAASDTGMPRPAATNSPRSHPGAAGVRARWCLRHPPGALRPQAADAASSPRRRLDQQAEGRGHRLNESLKHLSHKG
jgi:hypothetical protein